MRHSRLPSRAGDAAGEGRGADASTAPRNQQHQRVALNIGPYLTLALPPRAEQRLRRGHLEIRHAGGACTVHPYRCTLSRAHVLCMCAGVWDLAPLSLPRDLIGDGRERLVSPRGLQVRVRLSRATSRTTWAITFWRSLSARGSSFAGCLIFR